MLIVEAQVMLVAVLLENLVPEDQPMMLAPTLSPPLFQALL
jgi:hypothetical protein